MAVKPGDTVTVDFPTHSPTTGAATDADSLPTGVLIRNGADTAESVTVTNKETGVYKAAVTIPAGYVAGDEVQIRIHATVGGVADKEVVWGATLDSKRNADLNDYDGSDTAGTTTLLARLTVTRAGNLDNLDAAVSSRLADAAYTTPPTAAQVADGVLGRNVAGGSDAGRTVSEALYLIRNKWEVSGTTLTVYGTDDTTPVWTGTVTTTAEGHITGLDPA